MSVVPDTLSTIPEWQRNKVLTWVDICTEVKEAIAIGTPKGRAYQDAASQNQEIMLEDAYGKVRELKVSKRTVERKYAEWVKANEDSTIFMDGYGQKKMKMPAELKVELYRLRTTEGCEAASVVINQIKRRWNEGEEIEGIGTWQEWFASMHPGQPLLSRAPAFPICDKTMYNHMPARRSAMVAFGTRGSNAAGPLLPSTRTDYGNLAPMQVLVCDDVRLDVLCINSELSMPTYFVAYIAMDAATRRIMAVNMRAGNAQKKTDVNELLYNALSTGGLCKHHTTNIVIENGALTMTKAQAKALNVATQGRINIIHTGMEGRRKHAGGAIETNSGKWMDKAIIESFMHVLHLRLMHLPGQVGANHRMQPQTLGHRGQLKRPAHGSVADQAMKLCAIDKLGAKGRINLNLQMLTDRQLGYELAKAVIDYNQTEGRDLLGHGKTRKVWCAQTQNYEVIS